MKWNPETTPNFTREELACSCCGECEMDQDFMEWLQALRTALERPLTITSGYRCPDHPAERNKPSPGSHGQGLAVDIACTDGGFRHDLIRKAILANVKGLGVAKTFVHLDRGHDKAPRPSAWSY